MAVQAIAEAEGAIVSAVEKESSEGGEGGGGELGVEFGVANEKAERPQFACDFGGGHC